MKEKCRTSLVLDDILPVSSSLFSLQRQKIKSERRRVLSVSADKDIRVLL